MNRIMWEAQVREWLLDDLGRAGDVTTDSIVPANLGCTARLVAREAGVMAGLHVGTAAFELLDPAVRTQLRATDGEHVAVGTTVATVTGPARAVLSAERTCLNIICHLSGIATATRSVVGEALGLPVDVIMLDNFDLDRLRTGVQRVRDHERSTGRRVLVEASGGIRHDTAAAIAAAGVDLLSIGRLTNSSPNLDLALDIVTD